MLDATIIGARGFRSHLAVTLARAAARTVTERVRSCAARDARRFFIPAALTS
jgi:hypothetical protein